MSLPIMARIRKAGGSLELDGNELVIRNVPRDLIEELRPKKADVMAVLRKQGCIVGGISAWDWLSVIGHFRSELARKAGVHAIECRRLLDELQGLIALEDFEAVRAWHDDNIASVRSHYSQAIDPVLEVSALVSMIHKVFPNGYVLSADEMAKIIMGSAEEVGDNGG